MARWFLRPLLCWRARRIARALRDLVAPGQRVLDCGSGDGMVSRAIAAESRCEVTGLDRLDYGDVGIPFVVYDGRRMPFPDGAFDTSLLLFALHHCDDPDHTLAECRRVSRRLIVIEEVYTNRVGELFTKWEDWFTNRLISGSVGIPLNFRTREAWVESFESLGLGMASEMSFRPLPFIPLRTVLFDLFPRSAPGATS